MVCTGAKSAKESKRAVIKVVRELKKSGIIIIGKPEMKIQNIVASANKGKTGLHRRKTGRSCLRSSNKTSRNPRTRRPHILRELKTKEKLIENEFNNSSIIKQVD